MANWLKNEYVVLSGASGGIGRELCKILIEKYGANVIGIGRNESKMLSLKAELGENASKFTYSLFDVGERDAWIALKNDLREKGISPILLINNAGAFPTFSKVADTGVDVTERIMRTNYYSVVYAVEQISPLLQDSQEKKRNGKPKFTAGIVNISSCAALCCVVGTGAYSASKSAVKGYTEALQMEEKGRKYVGIIYPGTTATELFDGDKNTKDSALTVIAMPAKKMAKKIARKIIKRRKRAVLGLDAKLMSFTAKAMPVKGLSLICGVMKLSGSKVFDNVFDRNKEDKEI